VGSIGGTIVIGCIVVLFLFLKKRKRMTNQSPDFNDDSTTSMKNSESSRFDFKKLWGGGHSSSQEMTDSGRNIFAEEHLFHNNNLLTDTPGFSGESGTLIGGTSAGLGGSQESKNPQPLNNNTNTNPNDDNLDFVYRGVSNNNNLESVFRSSKNTSRGSSGSGKGLSGVTPKRTSRAYSFGNPLASPDEFDFSEMHENDALNHDHPFHDESSDDDVGSQYDDLINPQRPTIARELNSNNSQSRFTEEI
jgi:hypothetical protein